MTIPLQNQVVYGPLASRRFGKSLGINLLPTTNKLCSFDCVYCQYGETDSQSSEPFPSIRDIEDSVRDVFFNLQEKNEAIDWIMLSGNGEPTMHPEFPKVILSLMALRDKYIPGVPIGILSNSSTCNRSEIRDALMYLDGRFMKLDAGSLAVFESMNRPMTHAVWKEIVAGLYQLKRIVIQSMFVKGAVDNTGENAVSEWIRAIEYIRPEAVQVYTIERPTAHQGILPVSRDLLEGIAKRLQEKSQISALVFD